jgi:hypothetical protein
MASTASELKTEVREFTGYTSTLALSQDGLDTAYDRAKRHIRIEKSLPPSFDWFGEENITAENSLFWFTCLFTKVATGELTTWYRNAVDSMESIKSENIFRSASPARSEREYESDTFRDGTGGGSSGTEVDSTDI